MLESFRRKWAGPSGFASTLKAHDQKVVEQFRRLGGFTSKAYATRFEKTILPLYAGTARKLVRMFASLTDNGTVIDLAKNFKAGPELESQLRRTKGLMDELSAAFQMGLAEVPAGFDPAFLEKYRAELDKTLGILDKANASEEARRKVVEAGTLAVQKATSASSQYEEMTRKQIKASLAHVDAQEKELATRLKNFEVLREETFAKIDLKTAQVEEQKQYLATESAMRQETLARTNALQVQLREITQGKELDELGKKKTKQATKLIRLLEEEAEVRVAANKEIDKSITSTKKSLVANEQAITNYMVKLDDLGIVVANTQRQYDHIIGTWDEMARAQKVVNAAHKEHKASLTEVAEAAADVVKANEGQIGSLEGLKHAMLQAAGAEDQLTTSTREQNVTLAQGGDAIRAMVDDLGAFDGVTKSSIKSQKKFADEVKQGSLPAYLKLGEFMFDYRASLDKVVAKQNKAHASLSQWGQGMAFVRSLLPELSEGADQASASMDKGGKSTDNFSKAIDNLGKKIRNVGNRGDLTPKAIAGIIAVLGEPIAVLVGSVGPALLAVGGALSSAALGLYAYQKVFQAFNTPLEQLPPNLREVARGFQDVKDATNALNLNIAAGAFEELSGTSDKFVLTLDKLTPAFQMLGRSVGQVFDDFTTALLPGTRAFQVLQETVVRAGPQYEHLAKISGRFMLSLLDGFNQANPLIEEMLNWVDRLSRTFDDFVQGPGFDQWLGHAETIFSSLGPLLDTTGRMLNDLVTDESVARTAEFLDNLTAFMPALGELITIFGELNVMALITQLLVDMSAALQPLAEPMQELAAIISVQLGAAIEGFATVVAAAAPFIAAWAQAMSDVISVIPPQLVTAIAASLTLLAGALGAVVAVRSLSMLAGNVEKLMTALKLGPGLIGGTSKLLGALGKAGLAGAAVVGVVALATALDELYNSATDVEGRAAGLVASNSSIKQSYQEMGKSVFGVITPLEDVDFALDNLTGSGVEGMLGSLGNAFKLGGNQANALSQSLGDLDKPMATLAQKNLPAAAKQFKAWATELEASDEQVLNMINTMPEFKAQLEQVAIAEDGVATSQDLVRIALEGSAPALEENVTLLDSLKNEAFLTRDEIGDLSDAIRNFGDTQISTVEASSQFEQAIDDLTESITENGGSLDLNTQQGRDNQAALFDSIQAAKDHAAATFEETGSIDEANAVLATQKQRLYDTLTQMGLTSEEAAAYITQLDLIPEDVKTVAELDTAAAEEAARQLARTRYMKMVVDLVPSYSKLPPGSQTGFGVPQMAAGIITSGPMFAQIGEAGREAVVPLERPLAQVDRSVRWLAAIAQGKSMPRQAGGPGGAGNSKTVNISSGAITIQGNLQPEATATHTVNRIAERIAG
jgi:hypothetical protein